MHGVGQHNSDEVNKKINNCINNFNKVREPFSRTGFRDLAIWSRSNLRESFLQCAVAMEILAEDFTLYPNPEDEIDICDRIEVHSCFMQQMFVAKMEDCIAEGNILANVTAAAAGGSSSVPEDEFSVAAMLQTIGCVMEKGQLVAKMTKEQNQGLYISSENKESAKYD